MATKGAKPAKVGGNSNAGNKPVSSPPTAVVNGESNGESSNVEIVKLAGGKPDQSHHNQAMDELKKNIDKTQAEVNDLRSQLSEGGPSASSPAGQRRQALRTELEELRGKQAGSKGARGKVLDDLRALQDSIAKKVKDLQAAKSKAPFKSVAEVDAQIARLEAQVEAGSMKLAEEKRALTEISTLRRSKRNVEGLATQQAAIDADRAKADELRAGLDDPESKAVSKRYDEIKNELDTLQKEHEKTAGSRSKLVEQRVAASAKLDALYATKRERQSTFRSEMDKYFTKVNAEKEKRNERFKEEKKKEELEKKKAHEQQLREEAALPAFSKEIEDCDVLINYFSGASSSSTTSTTKPSTVSEKQSLGKKLELRTVGNDENVPEGAKVAKKKGGEDEEDAFFVGSSKKSSKKNKGKSKGTPLALGESPSDEPSGSANGSSGGPALHVPLGTLSALLALSIPPPTSQSDTTRVVENLRLKREYFVSNQERKTKENIEKVEKLLAKNGNASDEVDEKAQDEANKAPVANGNEQSEQKVAEKEEEKKDEE